MQNALNALSFVGGEDILVTRCGSGIQGDPYIYSVYFEGASVRGSVRQLEKVDQTYMECWLNSSSNSSSTSANQTDFGNTTWIASTVYEGGYVEIQQLRLSTESGYMLGDYYKLGYTNEYNVQSITDCLEWGMSGESLASALNELPSLSQYNTSLYVNTTDLTTKLGSYILNLDDGYFINGILSIGDVIVVTDSKFDGHKYTIKDISSTGTSLTLETIFYSNGAGGPGKLVYKILQDPVVARRSGTGDSVVEVQEIRITSETEMYPNDEGGFYKLAWTVGKHTYLTSCLAIDAKASDIQTAINNLGIDLNQDGFVDSDDEDHVQVTREGEGQWEDGYGYTYTFTFQGKEGKSRVLGDVEELRVVYTGSADGCTDVSGEKTVLGIFANTTTADGSYLIPHSGDLKGELYPGDRILIEGSSDPEQAYTVVDLHGLTEIELNLPFSCSECGGDKEITLVEGGLPVFAITTIANGISAYTYDIYFIDGLFGNVNKLKVMDEGEECQLGDYKEEGFWAQVDGEIRKVEVSTVREGGRYEAVELHLQSNNILGLPSSQYFKLFYEYDSEFYTLDIGGNCVDWDLNFTDYEQLFDNIFNESHQVSVTRSGLGDSSSSYGFTYNFTFEGDLVLGDTNLWIQTSQELGSVQFVGKGSPGNLSFFGLFNGSSDAKFTLTYLGNSSSNSTGISLLSYFVTSTNRNFSGTFEIIPKASKYIAYNISIVAGGFESNHVGDSWTMFIVVCDSMEQGISIQMETAVEGGSDIKEITFSSGYVGSKEGANDAYLVNQVFKVRNPQIEIQQLIIRDQGEDFSWDNGNPSYILTFGDSKSRCITWDQEDFEMEEIFDEDLELVVTVTRRTDDDIAPNGYVYTIYYDGTHTSATNFGDPETSDGLQVNYTGCSAAFNTETGESVKLSTLSDGHSDGGIFTSSSLPLASVDNANEPAKYIGGSCQVALPVYRVGGFLHTVKFSTNLGDVPSLVSMTEELDGADAAVSIFQPELATGYLPLNHIIMNLITGVEYYVRVLTSSSFGMFASSPVASTFTGTVPDPPGDLTVDVSLHVDEIQSIAVAATYVNEVQLVTTSADHITDVQMIQRIAGVGETVQGPFVLRFPEIQTITITSGIAIDGNGSYILEYGKYWSGSDGSLWHLLENTTCIPWNAEASDLENILESLEGIEDVSVSREGDATEASGNGYVFTISFVGLSDAGNVQQLSFLKRSNETCSPLSASVTIATVNEDGALGSNTGMFSLELTSDVQLTSGQGAYRLEVFSSNGYQGTQCIDWDGTADEVEAALEGIANVDSVLVTREGSGDADSNYGFLYTIFFDGNAMHDASNGPQDLAVNFTGCSNYATTIDDVVTPLSTLNYSYFYNITLIREVGTFLASDSPAEHVTQSLDYLPCVEAPLTIVETEPVVGSGNIWELSFTHNEGNVHELICNMNSSATGDCTVFTIVDGNQIGGTFTLNGGSTLASDVSAKEMENALMEFEELGEVNVTRTDYDGRGGYAWTITFLTAVGDVDELVPDIDGLTGMGVEISVEELVKGGQVGGTFTLSLGNETTDPIEYDAVATAEDSGGDGSSIQEKLMALPSVGLVYVSRSDVNSEGGYTWEVTFVDDSENPGDIDLLLANDLGLSGPNAVVLVREEMKGSEAVGNQLSLSFSTPQWCAHAQVLQGYCGEPVTHYLVEWDQSASFDSEERTSVVLDSSAFLHNVQYVQTFSSDDIVTGTFQLEYDGQLTKVLNAAATANELRIALEELTNVDTVSVSREYSRRELGILMDVDYGNHYIHCPEQGCTFLDGEIYPCQLIELDGDWYTIGITYDESNSSIPLGVETDCSMVESYKGSSASNVPVYGWANGYAWTITFLKGSSDPQLLASPYHDLHPSGSATMNIIGKDCDRCYYLPEGTDMTGLTLGETYFIRVWAYNAHGTHPMNITSSVENRPNQIPFIPEDVSITVTSGRSIEVFFCEPKVSANDIDRFEIQWDWDANFTHAVAANATCDTYGFGNCTLYVSDLGADCPYSYEIEDLTLGTRYYIRVAARNGIWVQPVSPTLTPPDNTAWSATLSAVPLDQAPDAPDSVTLYRVNGSALQVHVDVPERTGGRNITAYLLEVDTNVFFTSPDEVTIPIEQFSFLYDGGPAVYQLNGLDQGIGYYIRASSVTDFNISEPTEAENHPLAPIQTPNPPKNIQLSTAVEEEVDPIDWVKVSWEEPDNDGGSPILGYKIEYWEKETIQTEIQQIMLEWDEDGEPYAGTWTFAFDGLVSYSLKPSINAVNLRDALMNLNNGSSLPIGFCTVTRTTIDSEAGYNFTIMFSDTTTNQGNLPLLQVKDVFSGKSSVSAQELQDGKRQGGVAEIQVISTSGTGLGSRGASNPDKAVIRGWWRLQFKNSDYTVYLSSEATERDVENALHGIDTTGLVEVSRKVNSENGYDWIITFHSPIGDQPILITDAWRLWTTNGDAELTAYDGDNEVSTTGAPVCRYCRIGEFPVGYKTYEVNDSSIFEVTIDGLTTGLEYEFRVSALNIVGQSIQAYSDAGAEFVPLYEPSSPENANVYVKTWKNFTGDGMGDSDKLIVYYDEPKSDGGAEITEYLVELDPTSTFDKPIAETFKCPNAPDYSVWTVQTYACDNCTINDGSFTLRLIRYGEDWVTDAIPFDAVPMAYEEIANSLALNSTVHCTSNGGDNDEYCPSIRKRRSGSMQSKMNDLDSLTEGVQVSRRDLNQGRYIWSITFLDQGDDFKLRVYSHFLYGFNITNEGVKITKILDGEAHDNCVGEMVVPSTGGLIKGQEYYARVFAYNRIGFGPAAEVALPAKPTIPPGKPTNVLLSVLGQTSLLVEFDPPTDDGGSEIINYLVQWSSNASFYSSENASLILVWDGGPYSKTLTNLHKGTPCYVRVYAYNDQGYGLPQTSTPEFVSPHEEPSAPLNVKLGVTSDTMLTVQWEAPSDDGGSTVIGYVVEWDTGSSFSSTSASPNKGSVTVDDVDRSYTMTNLLENTKYYVRVAAFNSAGRGTFTNSWPVYGQPFIQYPGQPVNVTANPGSSTSGELKISWQYPLIPYHGYPCFGTLLDPGECGDGSDGKSNADGGASVVEYRLEWSVDKDFFATESDAGFIDVEDNNYKITNLTEGMLYFIRVASRNSVGYSTFCEYFGESCLGSARINVTSSE